MKRFLRSLLLAVVLVSVTGVANLIADDDPPPSTTVTIPTPPNPPELP